MARGATALDDWADQRWVMTKAGDGSRFLNAEGRLPNVSEFQLGFDPVTRRLSAQEGNRSAAAEVALVERVQFAVVKHPGIATGDLITKLKLGRGPAATRLRSLLDDGVGRLWRLVERPPNGKYWFPIGASQKDAEAVVDARKGTANG